MAAAAIYPAFKRAGGSSCGIAAAARYGFCTPGGEDSGGKSKFIPFVCFSLKSLSRRDNRPSPELSAGADTGHRPGFPRPADDGNPEKLSHRYFRYISAICTFSMLMRLNI